VLAATAAILAVLVLAHGVAARAFRRRIERLRDALRSTAAAPAPPLSDAVRALADRLCSDAPPAALVRLEQRCVMRFRPDGKWKPMTAIHLASARAPGFVWEAEVRAGPLLFFRVVDAYVDGRGLLEVRLFGSIPVARATGPDVDRGELLRYLAELPWTPDALRANPALRWSAPGPDTLAVEADVPGQADPARVELTLAGGDVVRAQAERPRTEDDGRPRPWEGSFEDHRPFDGRRLPARGEVRWLLDDGPFAYWRGEIVRAGFGAHATLTIEG